MRAFVCPRCGQNRARSQHSLCPVCGMLDDLVGEHGEHNKPNPSCPICKPRHEASLREGASGLYIRSMMSTLELTAPLARFLLRLDREGFTAATRHGAQGSRAMVRLRKAGHLAIETDARGVPYIRISAHSRYKALELLSDASTPATTRQTPQAATQRPQSSSHASCDHDATGKARAKCRAQRVKGSSSK